jgi:hypothetical protein
MWTDKNYKMLYANFGHNGMNYDTNTRTSSTFASAQQNQWLINGLLWLGGRTGTTPPTDTPIDPARWYTLVTKNSGTCLDARAGGTTNGTAIQQYSCNGTTAQQFQFAAAGDYLRINNRGNTADQPRQATALRGGPNGGTMPRWPMTSSP